MADRAELDGEVLRITRTFDAPRELVFAAWSDADRISAWSGCAQAESVGAEVDFREGGGYRHVIRIPEVGELAMLGTYTEIRAPERIAYTLEWEGLPEIPRTRVTVDFKQLDGGRTEIRLEHAGLVSEEMRGNVPSGWDAALERLAGSLVGSESASA